jgi:hypothetical protein
MEHAEKHKTKVGFEPSVEIEAKKANGDVYNEIDKYTRMTQAAFSSGDNIEEKVKIRCPKEIKELLQRPEEEVVKLLLPVYNGIHISNYEIGDEQPYQDDSTDIKIIDKTTGYTEQVQVTFSDSHAMEGLGRNKGRLERSGKSNELVIAALDNAIKRKLIYPMEERQNLILALDGWRTVKPNHLDYYKETRHQYMADSGFKEIWFIGHNTDTILRIFP